MPRNAAAPTGPNTAPCAERTTPPTFPPGPRTGKPQLRASDAMPSPAWIIKSGERNGSAIPVIIFSAHGANMEHDPQVHISLNKSRTSLHRLVATVHDRLKLRSSQAQMEVA